MTSPYDPTRVVDEDLETSLLTPKNSDDDATIIVHAAQHEPASVASSPEAYVIKDRFVLQERLGKGGMGQVYKALDLRKQEAQDSNPYVAIKFLGDAFSRHPKALISLQREAKKSQQLAHPNVLTVYDFDRDGDRVFMTMELLNGAPLSNWQSIDFKSGKKPTVEYLIQQMANGLAYAHQHGVVHSDLKPDNVFVTMDGRVKILDFGIARIAGDAAEEDSFDAGELSALTLRYASLEMLRRDAEPHPADDVYALGLMAYQLYAGKHPYDSKNAQDALGLGLSPQPLRKLKRHQWRAIAKAIRLERKDRSASATAFAREFTGSAQRNRVLIAAVLVLTITSGFFAWRASLPEAPAVPFSALPAVSQQAFTEAMALGGQSADAGDWDGAYRYFVSAWDLHPRNPEAKKGLDRVAAHLVSLVPDMSTRRQQEYLLRMITAYSEQEHLGEHKALQSAADALRARLADHQP
jgi:serine/threonine protein kinase